MVGDYYRYMSEYAQGDKLSTTREGAKKYYGECEALVKEFSACDPIRLGLALNSSVYHYEIMQDK